MMAAGPVVLAVKTPATASGSSSTTAWSPSTPAAINTRSTWPRRAEASATTAPTRPRSVTSKVIVSTSIGPRAASSLAAAPGRSRRVPRARCGQTARHQRAQHGPGDVRRTSHDHALSGASPWRRSWVRLSSRLGLGLGVARARAGRATRRGREVDTRPRRRDRSEASMPLGSTPVTGGAPLGQAGYMASSNVGPEPGILGEIDAPAGAGDDLVEGVEEGPGRGARRGGRRRASIPPSGTTAARGRRGRIASAPPRTTPCAPGSSG